MLTIFAVAAVVAVITASVILMVGPEWVWSFFGPPDLGPVAFETLERRTTPNDALVCPPHLCKARSDLVPPLFAVDANGLRAAMAKVIASEPRIALVHTNDAALTEQRAIGISGHGRRPLYRAARRPQHIGDVLAVPARTQRPWGQQGTSRTLAGETETGHTGGPIKVAAVDSGLVRNTLRCGSYYYWTRRANSEKCCANVRLGLNAREMVRPYR